VNFLVSNFFHCQF